MWTMTIRHALCMNEKLRIRFWARKSNIRLKGVNDNSSLLSKFIPENSLNFLGLHLKGLFYVSKTGEMYHSGYIVFHLVSKNSHKLTEFNAKRLTGLISIVLSTQHGGSY